MAQKVYTAAEDKYILLNYLDMSTRELARELGRAESGIRKHMAYIGVNKNKYYGRAKGHRVSAEIKARAYELYTNGMPLFMVSKEMNRPRQTVAIWIREINGYRGTDRGFIVRQSRM